MKDSRERFEAFHRERMGRYGFSEGVADIALRVMECGRYSNRQVELTWEFWQAAVEACEEIDINDCMDPDEDLGGSTLPCGTIAGSWDHYMQLDPTMFSYKAETISQELPDAEWKPLRCSVTGGIITGEEQRHD